ncbi:ABC-2 type transport system permease [Enterococcus sp. AZ048]|uniref:ABC transporter permease n=1 Tax=Enterococcus sp. AZ048 TaxID=2774658 RepID=UPI003F28ABC2
MNKSLPLFTDTFIMSKRCLTLSMRNIDTVLTSLVSPLLLLLLFVSLFGGAIDVGGISYINYIFPGIILQCIGQCAATTVISVSSDIKQGIIDRFLTMPIKKSSILTGHVLEAILRNLLTIVTLVIVGLVVGFRPEAQFHEWLLAIGIILLFVASLSWIAVLFGILANSPEGASAFSIFTITLPYLSSGFVPIETMPEWLQVFAENQPMTPIIETVRALLLGQTLEMNDLILSLVWCLALMVLFYALARGAFKKKMLK